ncbi:MAG: GvpL/GvpF family gas vesicle protein, partial [bacterium]|nr:GvpL/GvpF family gas vesicle protein [bacterium]
VRYCTIAEDEEKIKEKLLKARFVEFKDLLEKMGGKVELGVRAFWTNTEGIFAEIVSENEEIAQLKKRIEEEKSEQKVMAGKIKIGEIVKRALLEKKKKEAQALLDSLRGLAEDLRENHILGDRNFLNAAFLVRKEKEEEFDQKINRLEQELGERTKLNYFGPIPPCNFVEVVVTW